MKKFLSFSLIITAFVVVLGSMLVFDVIDFDIGQVHLVGSEEVGTLTKANETEIHNKIVAEIHNVGLTFNEISNLLEGLTPESNPDELNKLVAKVQDSKSILENLINKNKLTGKKAQIHTEFDEKYTPTLSTCIASLNSTLEILGAEDLTEEALNESKSKHLEEQSAFIEAHNTFTQTLNESR